MSSTSRFLTRHAHTISVLPLREARMVPLAIGVSRSATALNMPTRRINAFNYDLDTGAIVNPCGLASLASELDLADGPIVDVDGCLWTPSGAALSW